LIEGGLGRPSKKRTTETHGEPLLERKKKRNFFVKKKNRGLTGEKAPSGGTKPGRKTWGGEAEKSRKVHKSPWKPIEMKEE